MFFRFMDNLQTEVLEIEFLTYSKGMTTISEEDFAKILLRFTNVENISAYLENVRQCIPDEKVQHIHAHRNTRTNQQRCKTWKIHKLCDYCVWMEMYNIM